MKERILLLLLVILPKFVFSQTNFPGFDIIGKGYNIFGEFANNKSIEQYNIFDFSNMERKKGKNGFVIPRIFSIDNISSHTINTIEGNSIKEYTSNLSNKVGLSANAFFFKASFKRQFDIKSDYKKKVFYYTYMDVNTKWRISLDTRNKDTLIKYLDPQFKKDMQELPPKILFDRYGTHFIGRAYLGGRIDYSSISYITSDITTEKLKKSIKAELSRISNFGGNSNNLNQNQSILNQTKTKIKLDIVGGNSEYANDIKNEEQYKKWAEGIKNHPVLSNFDNSSLIPIWKLTNDLEKKNELKNYFDNSILTKYPIPIFFKTDPILDNDNINKTYNITINNFFISNDCDNGNNLFAKDESGDFIYNIKIFANGELIKNIRNTNIIHIWSGNSLNINSNVKITLPLNKKSSIKIEWELLEIDQYTDNELVGKGEKVFYTPFIPKKIYNFKDENNNNYYWSENLYYSDDCNATLFFQIYPDYDKTAISFGNKGWEEYLKGNYDKALYYTKKAIEIDNSLWFAQYNVALIYLIEQNPGAFQKYKLITMICDAPKAINAALDDIEKYERSNGKIKNSEQIKILLKSKIKY